MHLPDGIKKELGNPGTSMEPVYTGTFMANGMGEVEFGFENDGGAEHVKFSGMTIRKVESEPIGNLKWASASRTVLLLTPTLAEWRL